MADGMSGGGPEDRGPEEDDRQDGHHDGRQGDPEDGPRPDGLGRALGLTAASVVVWGIAHLAAGRRMAGALLMGLSAVLVGGVIILVLDFQPQVRDLALRRDWLVGLIVGIAVLALVWITVILRSYQVVRPRAMARGARALAGGLVLALMLGVCVPLAWAARGAYTLRDTIGTIFHADKRAPYRQIDAADPWKDRPRVNILLIGGDGAGDRVGVRTDSMTVASIDTRTGDTVLLGLPRNLQRFPVIPRLANRWPDGFTGLHPGDEGLLNELYQDAEEDPSLVPGYDPGRRGAELLSEQISYLIDQPVDYYLLVNLFGFADIVDAVGGVTVHIAQDVPFGGPEDGSAPTGVLKAGDRMLSGREALWFGRSRTASSDYVRMGRQKCLMRAIAQQADPKKVLLRFQQLAAAAEKAISTNIPAKLLPALVRLSATMKRGAQVNSLMFVPPRYSVYRPDVAAIRDAVAQAINGARPGAGASVAPSPNDTARGGSSASPVPQGGLASLTAACGG